MPQVMTEPFKTKATDLQPVVLVGDSLTLPVDVTDLNPANHVLRVRARSLLVPASDLMPSEVLLLSTIAVHEAALY